LNRDDSSLNENERARIKREAERLLKEAGAFGVFPTPVEDILAAAKLKTYAKPAIDDGFINWIGAKVGHAKQLIKTAFDKVLGLFDVRDGSVYIDQTVQKVKQTFLKLHEAGHARLPWQRSIYSIIHDCQKTLAPDVADHFDREANVFASEVLFQLDAFTERASSEPFGINVPMKIGKKFGASAYSSIRRYVSESEKACVVLVLEMPETDSILGYKCLIRRIITSEQFDTVFGAVEWPPFITPHDEFGFLVPIGKRMSRPQGLQLVDANGGTQDCVGEGFSSGFQVFLLIHQVAPSAVSIFF